MGGESAIKPQLNLNQKELTSLKIPTSNMILQGIMKNHSKRVCGSDRSLLATPTVARNKKPLRLLLAKEVI